MAQPPTLRQLRLEDLGDAASPELESLLTIINSFMSETVNALQGRLTRGDNIVSQTKLGLKFTAPNSGDATLDVAHSLLQPVRFALVGELRRQDAAALAAYSYTHTNLSTGNGRTVRLTFQGLVANEPYVCNVLLE